MGFQEIGTFWGNSVTLGKQNKETGVIIEKNAKNLKFWTFSPIWDRHLPDTKFKYQNVMGHNQDFHIYATYVPVISQKSR